MPHDARRLNAFVHYIRQAMQHWIPGVKSEAAQLLRLVINKNKNKMLFCTDIGTVDM